MSLLFVLLLFFFLGSVRVQTFPLEPIIHDKWSNDGFGLRQHWSHRIKSSNQDVLLGFRYVDEWKAMDYNYRKTLTAIPATADMIGEGAYLSPVLDQDEKYKGYWECTVSANAKAIKAVSKLFVRTETVKVYNPAAIKEYAKKNRKDVVNTIMFSKLMYYYSPAYQMLIPPMYLVASSNTTTAELSKGGDNILGLKVWCVQPGCTGPTPAAKWANFKIPQSPGGDPDWIHPHQIVRKAGPNPRCDQSPPKPDWVTKIFYLT